MTLPAGLPRQLRLDGSHNFRDLGGYPCAGGRRVRPGMLFRSDHLSRLSAADQALIAQLGIRRVIDLRREAEREDQPDCLHDPAIEQIALPIDAEGADVRALLHQLRSGTMDSAAARRHLLEANRQFVADCSGSFRQFFDLLAAPQRYPLVFHCTAGKDRAGFAAAMTLRALGASHETVLHDYLATNTCTAGLLDQLMAALPGMPDIKATPATIRALLRVERDYLEHALATADALHGSADNFMRDALGLGEAGRRHLQALLLEPGPESG